jgi:hypothetical protein
MKMRELICDNLDFFIEMRKYETREVPTSTFLSLSSEVL